MATRTAKIEKVDTITAKLRKAKAANLKARAAKMNNSNYGLNRILSVSAAKQLDPILSTIESVTGNRLSARDAVGKMGLGRVGDTISIIASKMNWPLEQGANFNEVLAAKEEILNNLAEQNVALDMDLLNEIRECRGSHTFIDKATGDIVEAKQPNYDGIEYLINEFANQHNVDFVDFALDPAVWEKEEKKQLKKANLVVEAINKAQTMKSEIEKAVSTKAETTVE